MNGGGDDCGHIPNFDGGIIDVDGDISQGNIDVSDAR